MFVSLGMEKEIKVIKQLGVEQTYDQNGNLIQLKNEEAGYYRNYTYDERNNVIYEEGLGDKNLQPYWRKWERIYNEDGSQTIHQTTSYGYWEKSRMDNDFIYDFVNSNKRKIDKYERFKIPGKENEPLPTRYEQDMILFNVMERVHQKYEKKNN